jgi:hypothetical protein
MSCGHTVNDVGEIGFQVQPIELCGFQYGVERGGTFTLGVGAQEQEVLPCHGDTAQ